MHFSHISINHFLSIFVGQFCGPYRVLGYNYHVRYVHGQDDFGKKKLVGWDWWMLQSDQGHPFCGHLTSHFEALTDHLPR